MTSRSFAILSQIMWKKSIKKKSKFKILIHFFFFFSKHFYTHFCTGTWFHFFVSVKALLKNHSYIYFFSCFVVVTTIGRTEKSLLFESRQLPFSTTTANQNPRFIRFLFSSAYLHATRIIPSSCDPFFFFNIHNNIIMREIRLERNNRQFERDT